MYILLTIKVTLRDTWKDRKKILMITRMTKKIHDYTNDFIACESIQIFHDGDNFHTRFHVRTTYKS